MRVVIFASMVPLLLACGAGDSAVHHTTSAPFGSPINPASAPMPAATREQVGDPKALPPSTSEMSDSPSLARDLNDDGATEDDQRLSHQIRGALDDRSDLTFLGKNVTVVVLHGVVTLRGTLSSDAERKTVVDIVRGVAGTSRVQDDLIVRP